VSVQLSESSDYTGGDLQVGVANATRLIGSAIVFPSYQLHRVHPVQSGERFSLVAWLRGEDGTGRYWADAERSYQALRDVEPSTRGFVDHFLGTQSDQSAATSRRELVVAGD
jgi:predicted 2-oxoglutarate/Fe(II)-dependent dioxygenase YbiX